MFKEKTEEHMLINSILALLNGRDRYVCLRVLLKCIFAIREVPDGPFNFDETINSDKKA